MSYHSKFTAIEKKISRLPRQQIYALVISSLAAISILDYLLPKDFPLSSFYLVPISIAAWVIGKRAAILVSLLATVPELLGVTTETYILEHPLMAIWHSVLFLSVMLTVTYLLEALRKELTARQSALQQSEADGQLALFISQHDSLTGLPNRSTFHAKLKASIQDAEECNKSFHVLFIDIDRFKQINDSLGHYAGDLLLKGMAKSLQSCIDPAEDLLARLSGDEFGIIFHSQPQGEKLALALMAASAQATMIEGQDVSAKISIGITTCPQDGTDAARLLICADLAMYHAKQMGGAAFRVYAKEMGAFAKRRQAIREGLRTALATNTLELHYQPIFFSDTDYIYGVEALLRWNCKHIPLLTTSELIAVATSLGPEDLTRKLISGSWKLGMKPQFQANINGFSGQTPSPI